MGAEAGKEHPGGAPLSLLTPGIPGRLATDDNTPSSHVLPCGALQGDRLRVGGQ